MIETALAPPVETNDVRGVRRRRPAGRASLLLVWTVLTSLGCGTLVDTCGDDRRRKEEVLTRVRAGRVRIYGGVRYDLAILAEAKAGWMLALYAIDIPFSLVVDTVLLPFTIPYNLSR